MVKRGTMGSVALVLGTFVTVVWVARASAAGSVTETSGGPSNVCVEADGAPCFPVNGADGGPADDGSDDGATDAGTGASEAGSSNDAAPPSSDAAPPPNDAASDDGGPAGEPHSSSGSGGCGCGVVGAETSSMGLLLIGGALVLLGARRSRRSV